MKICRVVLVHAVYAEAVKSISARDGASFSATPEGVVVTRAKRLRVLVPWTSVAYCEFEDEAAAPKGKAA